MHQFRIDLIGLSEPGETKEAGLERRRFMSILQRQSQSMNRLEVPPPIGAPTLLAIPIRLGLMFSAN
jgi:hypothetical protein